MIELEKQKINQNLFLKNREKLEMSGVDEVNSFDENKITAFTNLGFISIKGNDLHIKKFNTNTKELNISGKIDEIKYSSSKKHESKSFLSRLFK